MKFSRLWKNPTCPQCGDRHYVAAWQLRPHPVSFDRICLECGARYTMPSPAWTYGLQIFSGVVLLTVGVGSFLPATDPVPDGPSLFTLVGLLLIVVGIACIGHAIFVLRQPRVAITQYGFPILPITPRAAPRLQPDDPARACAVVPGRTGR